MIGVIASPADHDVVAEFFQLFKTPWEFHRGNRRYGVVLCTAAERLGRPSADLTLVYAGERVSFDADARIPIAGQRATTTLAYRDSRLPLYGRSVTFRTDGTALRDRASGQSAVAAVRTADGVVVRVGSGLFGGIATGLTMGQPAVKADVPSVDVHIALLRDLMLEWVAPLVEIPPVPEGHPFIACLTHDVDHPFIRSHKWDHTMFGFLYRAVVGSLLDASGGRASWRRLLTNWTAALKLPLVHAGLARDFWSDFDRYLQIEGGLRSTFFVIPFEGDPGRTRRGAAPARRASRYGAREVASHIRRLVSAGSEIGVHGIDAWRDSSKGCQELEEVVRLTGARETGIRMHWLYADEETPVTIEKAGFAYDATSGYNGTVGYRAGTTQVFKPPDALRLLELPLHVMDTALFYPCHLHLSLAEARTRVGDIIANAVRFGGTVTINWHDRSIAPERLWGDFYVRLIEELKSSGAWFATAGQAVAWFRKRRSASFDAVRPGSPGARATLPADARDGLPGLRLRIHQSRGDGRFSGTGPSPSGRYLDVAVDSSLESAVAT